MSTKYGPYQDKTNENNKIKSCFFFFKKKLLINKGIPKIIVDDGTPASLSNKGKKRICIKMLTQSLYP